MTAETVGVIPARMGSSRYPGKPLVSIRGLPMVEHVYRRSEMSEALDAVFVATCDAEIREAVEAFGGRVVMTSSEHVRATDRVAEAATGLDAEVVVLVQGDEPLVVPEAIDRAVGRLEEDPAVGCVTVYTTIQDPEDFRSQNTIKVIKREDGRALYLSRQPIPGTKDLGWQDIEAFKHVAVIPFRQDMLLDFAKLPQTPLEQAESIDLLRLLEHGYEIALVETEASTRAVDVPADRDRAEELLAQDPLTGEYT